MHVRTTYVASRVLILKEHEEDSEKILTSPVTTFKNWREINNELQEVFNGIARFVLRIIVTNELNL